MKLFQLRTYFASMVGMQLLSSNPPKKLVYLGKQVQTLEEDFEALQAAQTLSLWLFAVDVLKLMMKCFSR